MRTFALTIVVSIALLGGCKPKATEKGSDSTPPPAAGTNQPATGSPNGEKDPKYVSSVSGNNPVIPNQNGNLTVKGGEVVQSPRMAAARTVNNAQLKQLHLGMYQSFLADNRMQDVNEVMNDAKQNSQLFPLLKEEVIILTGTKNGEGVWAYSQYPQRNGNHYVVTSSGVSEMSPTDLKNRLTQEMSPIKMSQ